MKKYMLIAAILALSAFNIVGVLTQPVAANLGGLKCNNLTGCGSSAQCPGKGSATGCNIFCEDQSFISCPPG